MKQPTVKLDRHFVLGTLLLLMGVGMGLSVPLLLRMIIDEGSQVSHSNILYLVLMFLGNTLLISLGHIQMAKFGERHVAQIRQSLFTHIYQLNLSFFHYRKSGELASRIINDTGLIRDFLVVTIPNLIAGIVTLVGSVLVLFLMDWKLTALMLVGLPLMMVFIMPISKMSEKSTKKMQEEIGHLTGDLTEGFQEIELIKISTAEETMVGKHTETVKSVLRSALRNDTLVAIETPLGLLFIFGLMGLIFLYGGRRVVEGSLSVGTLITFMIYLLQLLNPVGAISNTGIAYSRQKGARESIEEILSQPIEENFGNLPEQTGQIVLDQVSFGYDNQKLILENICMTFNQGEKTALVGPSGSGKSTVVNLLTRFYSAQNGKITLNGLDISSFELRDWRQKIALVAQSNGILSGTIRDNLCFGLETIPTEEDLYEALKLAYLDKDVAKLSNGLDTYIGERGKLLSGGQRQRLQIARAYLKKPDILLFDEATANLDADAEFEVTQSLNNLLKGRTALVIAHRLSTVVDADKIYFLEDHQVTGQGTHEELLKTHESYRRFVQEQMI